MRPIIVFALLLSACSTGSAPSTPSSTSRTTDFDVLITGGRIVDGTVNWVAYKTWDLGLGLRTMQTGNLRQYVMFIVIATVALFVLISFRWSIAAN